MAEPVSRIRSFEPSDDKEVRFIIAKSNMECLAVANQSAYTHPLILGVWFALSCLFIEFMHWWPIAERHGNYSYLRPLPAFAAVCVPILALVDWINRPYFEKLTQHALRQPDIVRIRAHYSRSPASGFWILEHNENCIGILALDATLEDASAPEKEPSGSTKETNSEKQKTSSSSSSSTAVIRHFYVDEQYRKSDIQNDLLAYAVKHAFESDPSIERIKAQDSPLTRYVQRCLRSAGFYLEAHTETVGVFRWKLGTRVLEREEWSKRDVVDRTR